MNKKTSSFHRFGTDQGFDLSADLADEYARAAGIDPKLFKSPADKSSSVGKSSSATKKASGYKVPAKIVKQLVGS